MTLFTLFQIQSRRPELLIEIVGWSVSPALFLKSCNPNLHFNLDLHFN